MIFGRDIALGPILPVDIPRLFQWGDDPGDARLNEPYRPANWQRHEDFWLNAGGDASRIFFAIRSRRDVDIIGFVQILNIHPVHRSATIGLRIGDPKFRRRGLGRDALGVAIGYCWDHLNLTRLALSVFADNLPAIGLYATMGFREEGRAARAQFIDGRWIDVVSMALLHPDRLRD
ncbi:GNAT family N-acetyltransferase [Sphingomonas sp. CGMCC 1.13654]|uniref:GNAT family N-acetyltransferase n=1 Tax=Sphingomonas chungangi TaxID=2683589 RepID=A0A838KZY7_9SPHN|nr:GNAT family protein [Sphingomonas chungangi]MBA2932651.1 GNAT family N-acetyltransferase [Sphingomonas chungangi]MVW56274.1 GNAT family N-acetyltransferase [Sphingomonas chungangi]